VALHRDSSLTFGAADVALTRDVARSIERCELTFGERVAIDWERAVQQHRDYCARLESLGLEVLRLPADEACPDCCFVEDPAVVLDELAILTHLGAASRRAETPAIAAALAPHRRIERIAPPATLDGGDVLSVGRRIFVGLSSRTNAAGIEALRRLVAPHDYEVGTVTVSGCLHLKTAATALDAETLLANRAWLDPAPLRAFRIIDVPSEEPWAANVLAVRGQLWAHAGYPRSLERLDHLGYAVIPVDISEFVKAEGALTCKSLLWRRTGDDPKRHLPRPSLDASDKSV
jgi:dimethylargininase